MPPPDAPVRGQLVLAQRAELYLELRFEQMLIQPADVERALAGVGGLGHVVVARDLERREACVREALEAADALVAPTNGLAEIFRRAGVPAEKLVELVYAFDETPYAAQRGGAAPDPPRFGFLGQFAPHKGLGTLLAATRLLDQRAPERPWEVVLHGGAPAGRHAYYVPAMLGQRAARRARRVRIGAPFAPEEAPRVIAGLSALVLPAEWDENAPLSVLQARAMGVPVVGTDVPGISEVVRPEASGLVPVGDVAALADRMADVLDGRIGRDPVPGLPLSLDQHLDRIEALYARIRTVEG